MQAANENERRTLLAGAFLFIAGIWGLLSIPIAEGMNPSYNVSSESVSGLGVPYFSHLPVTCNTLPACAVPVQPSSAVIVLSFFASGIFALLGGYLLRKATDHKLFNLGVALVGVFLFLIGVSYIPFYLGTPTIDVINVMGGLHDIGSIGAFVMVFLLAVFAYRFTRGPFRYLSPTLGAVILASTLFFMSGNFLGVGFGGMERVLIYSLSIWIIGFGAYLLGSAGLD